MDSQAFEQHFNSVPVYRENPWGILAMLNLYEDFAKHIAGLRLTGDPQRQRDAETHAGVYAKVLHIDPRHRELLRTKLTAVLALHEGEKRSPLSVSDDADPCHVVVSGAECPR